MNESTEKPEGIYIRPEKDITTKTEAEDYVRMYLQECAVMQNNDSEYPNIQKILDELTSDKITPTEAVERAKVIRFSKMEKIG